MHASLTRRAVPRLGSRIRRHLAEHVHSTEWPAKSYIYCSGQRDAHLYIIEEGLVKTQAVSESGKVCILGIHTGGDIFGESVMVDHERGEAAIALTPVRLRAVTRSNFMDIISTNGLIDEWTRYTAARIQEQQDTITLHVTVDSQQRLAAILLMLAVKLGVERNGLTVIAGRFTHEDLSQIVGTTRSRIGLFLKQFQRDGLVRPSRDSYLVIDEPRLRCYVAQRT